MQQAEESMYRVRCNPVVARDSPGFELTGRDLWFTTRLWISTTEFFVIMNLFMATWRIKKVTIDLYLRNYKDVKCISRECLRIIYEHFQHRIMLISFFYLVLIHSVLFTIKLRVIWKILFPNFRKNIITLWIYGH